MGEHHGWLPHDFIGEILLSTQSKGQVLFVCFFYAKRQPLSSWVFSASQRKEGCVCNKLFLLHLSAFFKEELSLILQSLMRISNYTSEF